MTALLGALAGLPVSIGIALLLLRRVRRQLAEGRADLLREAEGRALAEARCRELVGRFSHSARASDLGEMAAGLAHELAQPLGAVANYLEGSLVLLDQPGEAERVRPALEKALASTLRAGEILRRIRRYVARRPALVERFAPNRLVEEVAALLRDEATRHGIGLRLDLAPELPWLRGDPVQILQVLVNLVRNAIQSVAASQPSTPQIVLETMVGVDGGVEFRVTDQGAGIPPDQNDQVFDAFFSTRAEGMGIGLAICRMIVEAHHGRLSVESLPGVRTTFRFELPPGGAVDDATDRLHRG